MNMGFEEQGQGRAIRRAKSNHEPMVVAGIDGNFVSVSPEFTRLLKYTPDELEGSGNLEHIFENHATYSEIIEHIQDSKSWEGHAILLDAGQEEFIARIKAAPQYNEQKEVFISLDFFDVARSKKNELMETRLLKAITQSTEVLFSKPDLNEAIPKVLDIMGKAMQLQRVYIYELFAENGQTGAHRRFDWVRKSVLNSDEYKSFQRFIFKDNDFLETLKGGNEITLNPRSKTSKSILNILTSLGIYSYLAIPVFIDDRLWGYIGFEDTENLRDWGRAERKVLKSLAHNIGALVKINTLTGELLNKNQQLENAIAGATDGLWVWDTQGNTYISPRMFDIFGYVPGEWDNSVNGIRALLKTEDTELLEAKIKEAIQARQPAIEFETVGKHKKGRYVWVKGIINFFYNDKGDVVRHGGSLSDISSEKLYELKIRRQEEVYQRLVNSLKEVVFETDCNGTISFLNNSWKTLTGRSIKESINKKLFSFITAEFVPAVKQAYSQLKEKQILPGRLEVQVVRSGKPYWTEVWLRGLYDSNYELTGVSGSIFDINSRRIAEAQLRESEERYRLLSENTKDIVCLLDTQGRYVYVSPSMNEMLGYPSRALLSKPAWDCIEPDDLPAVKKAFTRLAKGNEPGFIRYRVKHRKGHYVWVETVANVQQQPADKAGPILIQTATRDISQQKKAEEEIIKALEKERQLVELRTNLINMISHEFRTPLTTIKSSSDLMVKYLPALKKSDVKDRFGLHFKKILEQVNRINDLISGVLLLGRMDSGKIQFQPEVIDFEEFMEEFRHSYADSHPEETRLPDITFEGTGRPVKVDKLLLMHILRNLVSNALKYSTGKKNPELNVKFERNLVKITIKDYGIGITDDDQKNLFQSFFRGSNALTIPGTGLGLVIVKQFVEMHGGSIDVESKLNYGTTIQVTLPGTS